MNYFRLHDFVSPPDAWSLDYPRYLEPRGAALNLFGGKKWIDDATIELAFVRNGTPVDYSHAGSAIPVISGKAFKICNRFWGNSAQVVPGLVGGSIRGYYVVNILSILSALDERQSKYEKFANGESRHGVDKTGCYRWVLNPIIDPSKVPDGVHIFRLFGFGVMIFVSEPLHDAMVAANVTGAGFDPAF